MFKNLSFFVKKPALYNQNNFDYHIDTKVMSNYTLFIRKQ
jgi:hypothetical protein